MRTSISQMIAVMQNQIEQYTGLRCYDAVPRGTKAPFCYIQVMQWSASDTKTTGGEAAMFWLHLIAPEEDNGSHLNLFEMLRQVQGCLAEELSLPEGMTILRQDCGELETIRTDETGELHAILRVSLETSYE